MACAICKRQFPEYVEGDYIQDVHKFCVEQLEELQPYSVLADLQEHYELGDKQAAVRVLPCEDGQYYLREDVDKLLGR